MAQLGEWSGETETALDYWIRLLKLREDAQTREHAWRLASQQFDFDRSIPLLAEIMDQRPLTDIELDALIYGHESRARRNRLKPGCTLTCASTPASSGLDASAAKPGKHRAVRVQGQGLQGLLETLCPDHHRTGRFDTYLKLFDNKAAWQVLQVDNRKITDPNYWRSVPRWPGTWNWTMNCRCP
jgi:hypothetical protein